jgi:RNA methyltransferase, TrmH family
LESIKSIKDDRVVRARKAAGGKGREQTGLILLENILIINWAIDYGFEIEFIIVDEKSTDLIDEIRSVSFPVYSASSGILKKITDTNYLIPVIALAKDKNNPKDISGELVVVLDDVKDLGNIGTIIRTGNAFGIKEYLTTGENFDPFYRKTIESSRGRVFGSVFKKFNSATDTIKYLKTKNYQIVTTSPYGSDIQSLVNLEPRPVALVLGNETDGACEEIIKAADKVIQIPMDSSVESLNVGVAAGISIYELKIKLIITMLEEKIKSTLGRQINVLGYLIRQIFDLELRKINTLNSRQVVFLMVLQCDKQMDKEQVMKENGLLERELNDFIKPMIDEGLVNVSGDMIKTTEKTEERLSKLWAIKDNAESRILECLTEDEINTFNTLIAKVLKHSEEIIKSGT